MFNWKPNTFYTVYDFVTQDDLIIQGLDKRALIDNYFDVTRTVKYAAGLFRWDKETYTDKLNPKLTYEVTRPRSMYNEYGNDYRYAKEAREYFDKINELEKGLKALDEANKKQTEATSTKDKKER